jgi:tellurite resistance protein TerC
MRGQLRPGQEHRGAAAAQGHPGQGRVRRDEVLRQGGRQACRHPLLAVVAAIEAADLIFAVDSVPAVLAVGNDAFIVYTSNAFATLGLRALYFLLAGLLDRFHYLSKGLALILAFIAVKLILQASHKTINSSIPEIPSPISLAVIVTILVMSVTLSIRRPAVGSDQEQPPAQETESRADETRRPSGDPPQDR